MTLSVSPSFPCCIDPGLLSALPDKPDHSIFYGGAKKPNFSTDEAAKHITRGGYKFHDKNNDRQVVISYRFEGNLTPGQKERALQALRSWADLANVTFEENAQNADGLITIKDIPDARGGVATFPLKNFANVSADIGTEDAESYPTLGSDFPFVAVHELGHAIGLEHPGGYNGGGSYDDNADYTEDTRARSVMSYFSELHRPGYDFNHLMPSAPMMDDIAAIQRVYGINTKTRNTDTTYGFNSNSERDAYSLKSADDKPIFCVWDGGGEDTLDFSNFVQHQVINLNAEAFSDVGGLKGNVSIAKGVTVENAIGGNGNDNLTGNQANNRLKGGGGADTLTGGSGADTFIYEQASDSTPEAPDMLADFTSGVDKIDVCGLLKKSGIKALNFGGLNGRPGDALLSFDHKSGMGSLAIDLTGNGKADLLVNSKGEIKSGDVLGHDGKPDDPTPTPKPKPRSQDTIYGFNSTSGQAESTLTSSSDKPRFKVKDEGGIDTLDFSGFTQNQIIDLHAGSLSDVGGMKGNVSIDASSTLENAIGGTGNDLLIGNRAGNRLNGGGGADKLWGGGGADIYVYDKISDSAPDSPDLLMDFASGEDKIDVSRLMRDAGVKKLNFVNTLSGSAGDAVLSFNGETGLSSLGIDLTGDGKVDLLVTALGEIKPSDLVEHDEKEPDPKPDPRPDPRPDPKPDSKPDSELDSKPEKTEDTIYGFNSNTGKPHMTLASANDRPEFVVHDKTGNDTVDFSGFSQDQTISLRGGTHSSVGGMKENIFITEKTVVENAIGGRGNDRIIGNKADNVLVGGAGADHLLGGGGWNTFKYNAASDSARNSPDLLLDFASGMDKIDLSAVGQGEGITLNYVDKFTGKAGDTMITFNPTTARYLLAVDLTGDGKTDFLVKSTRLISPEDVVGLTMENEQHLLRCEGVLSA